MRIKEKRLTEKGVYIITCFINCKGYTYETKVDILLIHKMLSKEEERYLKKIWTNNRHAAAFAGPYKLFEIVKKEGKHEIGLHRMK
jgi:hypothetical protein